MIDYNEFALKPGAVLQIETLGSFFNCPNCGKTSHNAHSQPIDLFNIHEKCSHCFFITRLEMDYIENAHGIYGIASDTDTLMNDMNKYESLTEVNDKDLDRGPFSIWTDFLLHKLVTSYSIAIIFSKHKSEKVSKYCQEYLTKPKVNKCQ